MAISPRSCAVITCIIMIIGSSIPSAADNSLVRGTAISRCAWSSTGACSHIYNAPYQYYTITSPISLLPLLYNQTRNIFGNTGDSRPWLARPIHLNRKGVGALHSESFLCTPGPRRDNKSLHDAWTTRQRSVSACSLVSSV